MTVTVITLSRSARLDPTTVTVRFSINTRLSVSLALGYLRSFHRREPMVMSYHRNGNRVLFLFTVRIGFTGRLYTGRVSLYLRVFIRILLDRDLRLQVVSLYDNNRTVVLDSKLRHNLFFFQFSNTNTTTVATTNNRRGGCRDHHRGRDNRFFRRFRIKASDHFIIFFVVYKIPFRFRAKPLPTLFCPAAITFIGYRLRRAFSPTFIIFSEAGLHGSPLPHPKRGPRGVSNICAVLPQFNTGLGTVKATKYHS